MEFYRQFRNHLFHFVETRKVTNAVTPVVKVSVRIGHASFCASLSVSPNVRVSVSDQTFRTERITSEPEIDIKELQNNQEADYVPTLCNTDSKVKPWLPR